MSCDYCRVQGVDDRWGNKKIEVENDDFLEGTYSAKISEFVGAPAIEISDKDFISMIFIKYCPFCGDEIMP